MQAARESQNTDSSEKLIGCRSGMLQDRAADSPTPGESWRAIEFRRRFARFFCIE